MIISANRFSARAMLLGERINTGGIVAEEKLATKPLMLGCGLSGAVVVLRFGAVVFFHVSDDERELFLTGIQADIARPYDKPLAESLEILVEPERDDSFYRERALIREVTAERLQLIAEILAKSLALELYEINITASFDQIEPLARRLHSRWGRTWRLGELTDHIGQALLTEQRMVGRVEVREKPEVLWENTALEGFYMRLFSEYELGERSTSLDRKLKLITRTAETLLRMEESRRSLRAEWYIIVLIMVEILLTLYEWWFMG